jgi:hypothetical protein
MYLHIKNTLFALLVLATWLITSFPFVVCAECSCCNSPECKCGCTGNNHLQENFFQDQSHGKCASCIKCDSIPAKASFSVNEYSFQLEQKQLLTLPHDVLAKPVSLFSKYTSASLGTTHPFSSSPLFLINSTFLL